MFKGETSENSEMWGIQVWELLPVLPFQGSLNSGGATDLGLPPKTAQTGVCALFSASVGIVPGLRAPWTAPSTQLQGLNEGMETLTVEI